MIAASGSAFSPQVIKREIHWSEEKDADLLTLNEALNSLAAIDLQHCRVVELRVFRELTVEETGGALGIVPRTVKRKWSMAKAWLHKQTRNQ
jgi:DNA-directed RNA polymerase specialized sigma24 family protein